jgi:two-component system, OmpR family, sensor histidine kinase BaeS
VERAVKFGSLGLRLILVLLLVMLITALVPAFMVLRTAENQLQNPQVRQLFEGIIKIRDLCQNPSVYPEIPCQSLKSNLDQFPNTIVEGISFRGLPDPFNQNKWIQPTIAFGVSVALLIAMGIGLLFTYFITKPVQAVSAAAQKIASGDLTARVQMPVSLMVSGDELANLGNRFNQMAQRLETNQLERKQLIADIAHELRTPITVMQFRLDALEDGVYDITPEEIKTLSQQNQFLARLVEDLRLLTLADSQQLPLERKSFALDALVRSVAEQFKPRLGSKNLHLELAPCQIHADPDRIRQVLSNLLENAQKYAQEHIVVVLSDGQLSVKDDGAGIPESDLERVFDRFYRVDESRARATGGSGLGLAIVKAILEAHGANILASNHPNGGAVLTIHLNPIWRQNEQQKS